MLKSKHDGRDGVKDWPLFRLSVLFTVGLSLLTAFFVIWH